MKKGFLFNLVCVFASMQSYAVYQDTTRVDLVEKVIDEAQAHLNVLPEKTANLLTTHTDLLASATPEQKSAWHTTAMLSAIQVSDLDSLYTSLHQLSELNQTKHFEQHTAQILRGIGVWMRRSGHLSSAKAGYLCSIDYSNTLKDKVIAMINLGVVERNLGNLSYSNNMYNAAKELAIELEEEAFLPIIENNLGTLAISQRRYADAQQYFASALEMNQYLNRRSGEVLTANNLLLSFLYQGESLLFERLQPRVERLHVQGKDSAREAYFKILQAVHAAQNTPNSMSKAHQIIDRNIPRVNDTGIYGLLHPLLLQIDYHLQLPAQIKDKGYDGILKQQFAMCDWKKYSQDNHLAVLKSENEDSSTN